MWKIGQQTACTVEKDELRGFVTRRRRVGEPGGWGKYGKGCGNDGLEEARGKPLAELTGADLRVVVSHRLPQPLETSAYTAELSTFPQPRRDVEF